MFAGLFDSRPDLLEAIRSSAPIVAIDIPDLEMLDRVLACWHDVLFSGTHRVMGVGGPNTWTREDYDAVEIAIKDLPKAADKDRREWDALSALSLALPLIAISPASETHLPAAVLAAAPVRITFPQLDPLTITRAIRIVTGERCRDLLDEATAARITPVAMIVAIRFDRTPAECLAELRRLAAEKAEYKGGRNISLSELHGMDEAVAWARSTIRDLEAWRRGEIPWAGLDPGACLVGPPGTGKTLFAKCFSQAAKIPLVACSLARWQGTDEGHLGHLLRAMKRDFDKARGQVPCVVFIDEIDSFGDRSKVRHTETHAQYFVEVINGFLAQLDGIAGREGLIFLAASNDISRCDAAILRSGRLNRIIRIGLPNVEDLERMFRVRLGTRLDGADLGEICLLALGSTGADVERITNDAVRFARHDRRPLELADLRRALVKVDDRDATLLRRAAVHEAGHLLIELLLFRGEADLHATIARVGGEGGATVRTKPLPLLAGTRSDYQARLQVLLAGRTAEEIVFDEASHGAGGRRGSDLQHATALAAAMVASLGLAGSNRLLFLGPVQDTDELLSYARVRTSAHAELLKAAETCRSTLLSYRAALDEIAATLLRAGRIDGVTAATIIRTQRGPGGTP
ncbi:AAA family ATPase [Bradyrhizobium sp. Arg237L]|uniref:AAA family ATPase n=1 Tax=Bradyrhizobium sp. Arg237L TaxID=3003352 RepID=UPI00249F24FB|nr:AAA family ATPase [Bradyrhizobium sp. Arg237L]MDI4237766.1 AAA family ATPase [Bradyrhizobium sp. Arg237L]